MLSEGRGVVAVGDEREEELHFRRAPRNMKQLQRWEEQLIFQQELSTLEVAGFLERYRSYLVQVSLRTPNAGTC